MSSGFAVIFLSLTGKTSPLTTLANSDVTPILKSGHCKEAFIVSFSPSKDEVAIIVQATSKKIRSRFGLLSLNPKFIESPEV